MVPMVRVLPYQLLIGPIRIQAVPILERIRAPRRWQEARALAPLQRFHEDVLAKLRRRRERVQDDIHDERLPAMRPAPWVPLDGLARLGQEEPGGGHARGGGAARGGCLLVTTLRRTGVRSVLGRTAAACVWAFSLQPALFVRVAIAAPPAGRRSCVSSRDPMQGKASFSDDPDGGMCVLRTVWVQHDANVHDAGNRQASGLQRPTGCCSVGSHSNMTILVKNVTTRFYLQLSYSAKDQYSKDRRGRR